MDLVIVNMSDAGDVDVDLRDALTSCWVQVTNAGGAVGFPFPPVDAEEVGPAVDDMCRSLHPDRARLLLAYVDEQLAGWVTVVRNPSRLTAHWATIQRLQTATAFRGLGIGRALMVRARSLAVDELGVDHLWLSVRGGMGLEAFYEQLGWTVTGTHPSALRLGPDDTRDEIFMTLIDLEERTLTTTAVKPGWRSAVLASVRRLGPNLR
jgi:GNAT superfamily N-acetyltransferase